MTLVNLTLGQFLAVLGGAAAVVTALYLVRTRARRAMVPFLPLWTEVFEAERRANPLKRLRRLLSFLVYLVLVGTVALALADPRPGRAPAERHLAIIVDASASMQASEGGGRSRFERARDFARRVIAGLRRGERAMILSAEAAPRLACRWSDDRAALAEALDQLTPSETHADLSVALRLAADALSNDPAGHVLLLTDAGPDPLPAPVTIAPERLTIERFGAPADNVALTAFGVRATAANPLLSEVYVEVTSFAAARQTGTLRLFAGDARAPMHVWPVEIDPGALWRRTVREPLTTVGPGPLRAELDLPDALQADNVAYAYLPPLPPLHVELVADTPDFFLLKAIEARPNVTITRSTPAAYRPAGGEVVPVFLRSAPDTPAATSAIYINPPPDRSPVPVAQVLARVLITEWDARHPVLREVDLREVETARALALRTRPGDAVLARSLDHAIMIAREEAGRRLLVVGFDPAASDLPLRVAFPIVVANALHWIWGLNPVGDDRGCRVGEPLAVAVGTGASTAEVSLVRVTGAALRQTIAVRDGSVHLTPRSTGFYTIGTGGEGRTVAVSTVDRRECDLRESGPAAGVSTAPAAGAAAAAPPGAFSRLWPALLWAALVLAAFEWLTYHRRWTL